MANITAECTVDVDCDASLWCYKGEGNASAYCDCPSFFGRSNADNNCQDLTVYSYFWVLPTILGILYSLGLLGYNLFAISKVLRFGGKLKVTSAFKIWMYCVLAILCMLISLVIRLWMLFNPVGFRDTQSVRTEVGGETVVLKVDPALFVYVVFFMASLTMSLCAVVETGIVWLELTYYAKKMAPLSRFGKVRLGGALLEAFLVIASVVSISLADLSTVILFGILGVPVLLGLLVGIWFTRKHMLDLLVRQTTIANAVTSDQTSAKFNSIARSIDFLSKALMVTLSLCCLGGLFMFLAILQDWKQLKPGEFAFFLFAFLTFEIALLFGLTAVLTYTLNALTGSLRSKNSAGNTDSGSPPRGKTQEESYNKFDSELESPAFNAWKRKMRNKEEE